MGTQFIHSCRSSTKDRGKLIGRSCPSCCNLFKRSTLADRPVRQTGSNLSWSHKGEYERTGPHRVRCHCATIASRRRKSQGAGSRVLRSDVVSGTGSL